MKRTVLCAVFILLQTGLMAEAEVKKNVLPDITAKQGRNNDRFKENLRRTEKVQYGLAEEVQRLFLRYEKPADKFGTGSITAAMTGLGEKLKAIYTRVAAAGERMQALRAEAETVNDGGQDLLAAAAKPEVGVKNQVEALSTVLETQSLLSDFSALEAKVRDRDRALDLLSDSYDKSLLGAYLKDKIGLLLNSQTMCEAVSRCRPLDRSEVSTESIQKTLFPGTEGSSRKGNLWEKTHPEAGVQ